MHVRTMRKTIKYIVTLVVVSTIGVIIWFFANNSYSDNESKTDKSIKSVRLNISKTQETFNNLKISKILEKIFTSDYNIC